MRPPSYLNQTSPLASNLSPYDDFFALFGDFRGYTDFFLLDYLVTNSSDVRFLMPFDDFQSVAVPRNIDTYARYRRRSIEFIGARNNRIAQLNA